jgi:hypothetical protein
MQQSIITSAGRGEYIAHNFGGDLIATIKDTGNGFEVYHYGGQRHGQITIAKTMPCIVSTLADVIATACKHQGSFLSDSYGACELFERDGATYMLLLTGIMAGTYFVVPNA